MRIENIFISSYLIAIAFIISSCSRSIDQKVNTESSLQQVSAAEKKIVKAELGKSRKLSPDFMCYNVNSTQVADWQDEALTTAVNSLSPSLLRIPGGDVGNYWNWQRGGLIENTNSLPAGLPFFLRFKARQYTASKLEDFKAGLANSNTKAIFVLNMLTRDIESQLEMLRQAEDLGLEIEYVELGNEFYFNIPNYKKTFPNPRAYGLVAKEWTAAVKQEFPNAKISVVGVVPSPNKPARLQNWNKVMRGTVLPVADAITLHIYSGHGLDDWKTKPDSYPYFQESQVSTILGEPFRNWQSLRNDSNYQAIPNDKQIWITEYNLFEDIFQDGKNKPIPRVAGSWTHGLYNLAISLLFLEEARIESICNHSLSEGSIFGAILNSEDSFVNPANDNMTATPMSLSATGSALSLLGEATQSMTKATAINFVDVVQLKGKDNFNYPAVYGWQFNNDFAQQAVIVNLSSQEIKLDLSNLSGYSNYQQISGKSHDLVNNSTVLTETNGKTNSEIILPAYSVSKLY
ncbi:MAG: hypothetical protein AAFQ14_04075 [Cyanobacteria bacterium J06621_12]